MADWQDRTYSLSWQRKFVDWNSVAMSVDVKWLIICHESSINGEK